LTNINQMSLQTSIDPSTVPFRAFDNALAWSVLLNKYVRWLLYVVLEAPLMTLYFNGPQVGGYGFWEGLSYYEICAQLTGVGSHHWLQNGDECAGLVERKFAAFLVSCYFVAYLLFLQAVVRACVRGVFRSKKISLYKQSEHKSRTTTQ
jgi:hypothetical protein